MTTEPDQFECQCVEGYEGDRCELMVTDECDPDPCQNGGTCTVRHSVYMLMKNHALIISLFRTSSKTLSASVGRGTREICVRMK